MPRYRVSLKGFKYTAFTYHDEEGKEVGKGLRRQPLKEDHPSFFDGDKCLVRATPEICSTMELEAPDKHSAVGQFKERCGILSTVADFSVEELSEVPRQRRTKGKDE